MAATINTVALKLPEFSPDRIEYWFIAVEAEFNLRVPAITQDQTSYSYVVSALKGQVMDRVIDIIRNPPAAGTRARARYSLPGHQRSPPFCINRSPIERSKTPLDWPVVGDGALSALLSKTPLDWPVVGDGALSALLSKTPLDWPVVSDRALSALLSKMLADTNVGLHDGRLAY